MLMRMQGQNRFSTSLDASATLFSAPRVSEVAVRIGMGHRYAPMNQASDRANHCHFPVLACLQCSTTTRSDSYKIVYVREATSKDRERRIWKFVSKPKL